MPDYLPGKNIRLNFTFKSISKNYCHFNDCNILLDFKQEEMRRKSNVLGKNKIANNYPYASCSIFSLSAAFQKSFAGLSRWFSKSITSRYNFVWIAIDVADKVSRWRSKRNLQVCNKLRHDKQILCSWAQREEESKGREGEYIDLRWNYQTETERNWEGTEGGETGGGERDEQLDKRDRMGEAEKINLKLHKYQ